MFKAAIAKVLLCLRVDSCSLSNDLRVLSVDGFKCLISVHHCAEDHRLQENRGTLEPGSTQKENRATLVTHQCNKCILYRNLLKYLEYITSHTY